MEGLKMSKESKSVKIGRELVIVKDAEEPEQASGTKAVEPGELGNPKLDPKPSGPSRRE